jgi:DNA-binding transcriptional regulator GbsR (MarR family)
MKTDFPERVIGILRGSPDGLTSKDIAERLGTTAGSISSRLSKLAAYGVIGKGHGAVVGQSSRENVYRAPNP